MLYVKYLQKRAIQEKYQSSEPEADQVRGFFITLPGFEATQLGQALRVFIVQDPVNTASSQVPESASRGSATVGG